MNSQHVLLIFPLLLGLGACAATSEDPVEPGDESGSEAAAATEEGEARSIADGLVSCGYSVSSGIAHYRNCSSTCQRVRVEKFSCVDATVNVRAGVSKRLGYHTGILAIPCEVSGARYLGRC